MSKVYIWDTSAILTLIEGEAGAERVAQVLQQEKVLIPWVVLLEMYYITQRKRGRSEADARYAMLKKLPVTILWNATEQVLLMSANLKAVHRISFGDSIVAGFAIVHKAILLHKDPEFEALKNHLALEALPYKTIPPKLA